MRRMGPGRTVFSIMKANVGSGVLLLPRAALNGGWVIFVVGVLFVGSCCVLAALRLLQTRRLVSTTSSGQGELASLSYGEVLTRATGSVRVGVLVNVSIVLLQTGFCVAYLIVISQLLQQTAVAGYLSETGVILVVSLVLAPLACLRRVAQLAPFNAVADVLLLGASGVIFYLEAEQLASSSGSVRPPPGGGGLTPDTAIGSKIPVALGTICLVFEGISNALPTYDESDAGARFSVLYVAVFAFLMVLFVAAGLCGLAAFGDATATIVLCNFSHTSILPGFIRYCFAVALVFTYPFALLPAVRLLEAGLFLRSVDAEAESTTHRRMSERPLLPNEASFPTVETQRPASTPTDELHDGATNSSRVSACGGVSWLKFLLFRICVVGALAGIAIAGRAHLDNVNSLVGSFCGVPLVFLYPPIAHWCWWRRQQGSLVASTTSAAGGRSSSTAPSGIGNESSVSSGVSKISLVGDVFLMVVGLAVFAVSSVTNVLMIAGVWSS